jgi:Uma2 family endonuclease
MSESSHFRVLACLYSSLQAHFGQENAPYIAVQTPLHYDSAHPTLTKQPDLMVVKGVSRQDRARFNLWEESETPSVVFEITSDATWMEDLVNKSALYMQLGVKEYFIFDPQGEFLRNHIQGLRLVDKDGRREYVPVVANKDGTLTSQALSGHLLVQGDLLRLVSPAQEAGAEPQLIPWAAELHGVVAGTGEAQSAHAGADDGTQALLTETQTRLRDAEERLRQAEERARLVDETARRNSHDTQRLKTLEAENAHLRVLLGQMQGTKVVR